MHCSCRQANKIMSKQLQKFEAEMVEMIEKARRLLKTASDPVTAVVKFLHEQPEHVLLEGQFVKDILLHAFDSPEQIPGLVKLLSSHIKHVVRSSDVIAVYNEHLSQSDWGGYLVRLKEQVNFEVAREKGKFVLKNIAGLTAIEHGIELPLEKILINPPKLEVTVKLGLLRPVRAVDII